VAEIVAQMDSFSAVFEEGTIEEKKEFVALFVEKIVVNAKQGKAKVHIRRFPAPGSL